MTRPNSLQAQIDEIVAGVTTSLANALANATANEIAEIARNAQPMAFRPRPGRAVRPAGSQPTAGGTTGGVKELVLTYLTNNPGPRALRDIAMGVQRAPEYVSNVLRALREAGKVSMEGDRRTAVYQLVGDHAITEPAKVLANQPPPNVVQPGQEAPKHAKLHKKGRRAA